MSDLDPTAQAHAAIRDLRQAAVRWMAVAFSGLLGLLALFNLSFGYWGMLAADAIAAGAFLSVFFAARRMRPELATYLLLGGAFCTAYINAVLHDGLWSGSVNYFPIFPVMAGLLGGKRPTVVFSVVGLLAMSSLLAMHALGMVTSPAVPPPGATEFSHTLDTQAVDPVAIIVGVTIVTYAFLVIQERAYRAWATAAQEAHEARAAQARFLASMSHELRTPLHGVIGALGLVDGEKAVGQDAHLLTVAKSSADVLLTLINNVLDFSRLEAGKVDQDPVHTDVRGLLQRTLAPLGVLAERKGLALRQIVEDDVPPNVLVDGAKLQQVLLNLTGNAIKFTESGEVAVRVSLHGPDALRLTVRDTGIGLTEDQRRNLFEPFEQADQSISRRFGGTGLGLAIVARLVEVLGGEISVESVLGAGTTFIVDVPAEACASLVDASSVDDEVPLLRILVVDDHPVNRMVIRSTLGRAGHDVVAVEGGQEAIAAVAEQPFDIVLMDVHMPGMDGFEATRRIRAAGHTLPILALTASPDAEHRKQARAAGMNGLLGKPIVREALDDALVRAMQDTRFDDELDTIVQSA